MTLATILPTPRTVFLDTNDNPLAGGSVYTYIPNTTTPKTTWQDAGGVTANANPIILDGNGACLLYGSGQYTLSIYDSSGNLVYTGLTQDISALILAGNNTYTGNNIFEGTSTFTGSLTLPNNFVTNANLAYMAANTVKVNDTNSLTSPTDLALSANTLLGRGSSGNISPITLGTGLSFSTDVLNGSPPLVIVRQIFTTPRTYTPTSGMLYCIVECQGAGGGGGGAQSSGGFSNGGGGGSYARVYLSAATVGASQSITIGAGGTAGSGAGATNGGTGGTTSMGTLISSGGGIGGATGGGLGIPSAGGTATIGDLLIPGWPAPVNYAASAFGGPGANSLFGAGGNPQNVDGNGNVGTGYGSGGSGGYATGATARNGGAGAHGVIIITEYCS